MEYNWVNINNGFPKISGLYKVLLKNRNVVDLLYINGEFFNKLGDLKDVWYWRKNNA